LVRIAFFLLLVFSALQATLLEDKIQSFVEQKQYKTQKNLIRILFKDESRFVQEDGAVDDIKVLEQLKQSGLLKLFYKKPQILNLALWTKGHSLIFMRVINETLSSMGYNYFLTKQVKRDENGFLWDIVLSTEHIVDPIIFAKKLTKRGCSLDSIDKMSENEWKYSINTDNIGIEARTIEANRTVKLKKPIKPYWIVVENMRSISLRSKLADRWHPNIIFFDAKLHIIEDYRKDTVANTLKLKIPINAKYVKVADMYTLDNIKRGMSVYLKRRN